MTDTPFARDDGGYRLPSFSYAMAAVEAATGAAHMLMQAVRDEDAIDVTDVLSALCDAVRSVILIESRDVDNQLLGAVEKWQGEEGVEVYGEGRL